MHDFIQWLKTKTEDGLRTSLGIYPPQYGVGQYPPLYFMPISATAAYSLEKNHKDVHPELRKKKKKHKKSDKKKSDKKD